MADIAREAGVSISAVSLVARGHNGVSGSTRQRIITAMDRLGYTQRTSAGHTPLKLFGLLIEQLPLPVLSDIFYAEVIQGIQEEALRLGYPVVLQIYGAQVSEQDLLREISRKEIAGLLVAAGGDIDETMIEHLAGTGVPVVLVETLVRDRPFHCVLADNFNAGHLATQHLIQLGHRKIAALSGPRKYSSLVDRLRGYYAALGEAGIAPRPEYVPPPRSGRGQKGYDQMKELLALPDRPTAVFAVSDKSAFGALDAIHEAGLRVPDDVAVVSIDDVSDSAHTDPPLTTVRVPKREIGILAARRLHELVNRRDDVPSRTIVYSELIVRDSCGAHRASTTNQTLT
jgi:DNA-binding LacI/PurR family transcriptional regulator